MKRRFTAAAAMVPGLQPDEVEQALVSGHAVLSTRPLREALVGKRASS